MAFNTHILYKGRLKYEFESHRHELYVKITYKEIGVICDNTINEFRLKIDDARLRYKKLIKEGFKTK